MDQPTRVAAAEIAGMKPAPGQCLARYLGLVPIAKHEGLAAIAKLPSLVLRDRAVVVIEQRHSHSGRRITDGVTSATLAEPGDGRSHSAFACV